MIDQLKQMLSESVTLTGVSADLARLEPALSEDEAGRLAAVVVPFVQGISEGVAYAIDLSRDPRCGRAVAHGTGSMLVYLLDDEDLLPESTFGALGLIDDAFLVHAFLTQVRGTFPYVAAPQTYRPPRAEDVDTIAALLPSGVAMALTQTCRSMVSVAAALFPAPGLVEPDGAGAPPVLRVRQCLAVLGSAV